MYREIIKVMWYDNFTLSLNKITNLPSEGLERNLPFPHSPIVHRLSLLFTFSTSLFLQFGVRLLFSSMLLTNNGISCSCSLLTVDAPHHQQRQCVCLSLFLLSTLLIFNSVSVSLSIFLPSTLLIFGDPSDHSGRPPLRELFIYYTFVILVIIYL